MSGRSTLTLDLGNSALKLVDWRADAPVLERLRWSEDWRARLRVVADDTHDLALISSVVDEERRLQVEALVLTLARELRTNPPLPLAVECRDEATVGRDRLHAALGAWSLGAGPAVVVDAGTALTVDALAERGGRPTFLGGAIAPGPALLVEALRHGGAQLARFPNRPRADAPALGRDSREALEAGVSVGFQGALRELARRVALEAGLPADAPVFLTGGASALAADDELFGGRVVRRDPLLVHRGLLAAVEGSRG